MLRQCRDRGRWLLLGLLPRHVPMRMVMVVMDMGWKWNSRERMVVWEVVVYCGKPHGVVEQVMVMVMVVVMGPKRQERHGHRHEARRRRHRRGRAMRQRILGSHTPPCHRRMVITT